MKLEIPNPDLNTNLLLHQPGPEHKARHYVKCIKADKSAGLLLKGRIYEVACDVLDGNSSFNSIEGFILAPYTTVIEGQETLVTYPYCWAPSRFTEIPEDEVFKWLEPSGHLWDLRFTRNEAAARVCECCGQDITERHHRAKYCSACAWLTPSDRRKHKLLMEQQREAGK